MPRRNSALFIAVLLLGGAIAASGAQAPPPAPAPKPAPAPAAKPAKPASVETSTPAVFMAPMTIQEVYNGTGLRDPLVPLLGKGGGGAMEADTGAPPSIHNLLLHGVIMGSKERLAIVEDSSTGARYVLKDDGKLYNTKGKPVPGIVGSIKTSKTVLMTTSADNDVQWLRMGGEQSAK
jgi:hypothetical protein